MWKKVSCPEMNGRKLKKETNKKESTRKAKYKGKAGRPVDF